MEEIWRPVIGYEGFYEVSNLGRVKSLIKHNGTNERILQPPAKDDYAKVGLMRDGFKRTEKVHRLVAQAFIPNHENKPQINHINGIRHDNRVENLEWCTQKENNNHAVKIGVHWSPDNSGSKNGRAKLNEDMVKEIVALLNRKRNQEIAAIYSVTPTTISEIRHNKIWKNVKR